jgi:hypothetical protein
MSVVTSLHHEKEKRRPELRLTLACARTRLDEATAESVRALLRSKLDWPDVVATASQHHVSPFLYANLKLAGKGLVPNVWLECLGIRTREASGMAMLLLADLLRILKVFEAEPFPLIPYKGPVLGRLAYGSLTQRTFVDLDFVLQHKHIARAAEVLESAGYRAETAPREHAGFPTDVLPGQYSFVRDATRAQVELHTERTLRYFPAPLDVDKLSRRFISVEIAGTTVRTFAIEDTLVMLCVHGNKHLWDRLAWIVDVAELIAAQPVDWDLTMECAGEMKSTRVLLLGLYLANELLDASVPPVILQKARQDSAVRWLACQAIEQLNRKGDSSPGALPRAVFRLRSRDRIAQGIRHTLRLAVTPTSSDHENIHLPRRLAFLYALVRPWQLLKEHGWAHSKKSVRSS